MGLPKLIDVCRADLFTGEAELRARYDAVTISRLLRVRDDFSFAACS